ncbi:MAG: redox-sensing transcriptional repressor Rex [Bacteroidales bacterium]|nr:redox-sensing transcriptional repressor Rex [Bacteroidales bacterium]MCF8343103.1 redox-sensing transcriptional repressor Rex [Bacteroidales bacterium]MCF8349630.1 redox-sensing transcriptional repressor Rex [Bacteroidales bacterium]MCF8376071.1 redox-sensing transcriptional repressor Rex [Bacteroidales bacterium]MCF8400396.1 redox-sensing transcriptional repressor Rex [Bacteroidales bacterium]
MDKNNLRHLPHKTIERLSQYRRALLLCHANGKTHIFSHEIAKIQHITAVQVRRDIMLIGYTGTLRKGYNVEELIVLIGKILDTEEGLNVAVVGVGNLGRAITNYFRGKRTKLSIVAAFDKNPDKIGKKYSGVECFDIADLKSLIKQKDISIGIITVTPESAAEACKALVEGGIKGILNYTPKPVNVPPHVYLEEYDMITSLEKVAFFVKTH